MSGSRSVVVVASDDALGSRLEVDGEPPLRVGFDTLPDALDGVDCVVCTDAGPWRDALATVRERAPRAEFVLVASAGDESLAVEALGAGCADYLATSVDDDTLNERVGRAAERARERRAVCERLTRYRTVVEGSNDAVLVLQDGRFVLVNDRACESPGRSREDLLSVDPWSLVAPEDAARVRSAAAKRRAGESAPERMEFGLVRPDGEPREVELSVRAITLDGEYAVLGIARDVTERNAQARALRERAEHLSAIARNLPMFLFVLDRDGTVVSVEGSALESLGLEPADVVGRHATDIYPGRDDIRADVEQVLGGEINSRTVTLGSRVFDGWMVPVFHEGAVDRIVGLGFDRTDYYAHEEALEAKNERLDEFASLVSHDLRNPLTVAAGSLQLYRETGDRTNLDRLESSLERMGALIDELLTLAREGQAAVHPTVVSLAAVARDAWRSVESGGAPLEIDTDRRVLADGSRLQELLENLFSNAIEHAGADVTVRVSDHAEGFCVEDDGPGIPPEKREAVFASGFSTSPEGTGFGLAIVRTIAEDHGWEVRLEEGDLGGACFVVSGVDGA